MGTTHDSLSIITFTTNDTNLQNHLCAKSSGIEDQLDTGFSSLYSFLPPY